MLFSQFVDTLKKTAIAHRSAPLKQQVGALPFAANLNEKKTTYVSHLMLPWTKYMALILLFPVRREFDVPDKSMLIVNQCFVKSLEIPFTDAISQENKFIELVLFEHFQLEKVSWQKVVSACLLIHWAKMLMHNFPTKLTVCRRELSSLDFHWNKVSQNAALVVNGIFVTVGKSVL